MAKRLGPPLPATKLGYQQRGDPNAGGFADPEPKKSAAGRQKAKVVTQIKMGGRGDHAPPVRVRRQPTGNIKPMRFVSLHHHSTFSYLDGYQLPEAHVRRAEELNMGAVAMTEHGNIDSHVKFEAATDDTGIKPLFGCEVYMPAGDDWRTNEGTQRKYHLTILAKDDEGYGNLLGLVSDSWNNFYYEPTVTWENLCKRKKGLIILSGCQGSLLFCSTVGGKNIPEDEASYRRGLRIARAFAREFGSNYFIEVQAFPELAKTLQFNVMAGRLARAVKRRLVATMDCHYTDLDDAEVQKILHNLRPGEKRSLEEMAREWGYDVPLCPPPNDMSIYRRLCLSGLSRDEAIEAIVSTEEIAQSCTVELPKLPMVRFPVPRGFKDAKEYWRHLLKEGWRRRGFPNAPAMKRKAAKAQLKVEMDLIESKDFVDYFLLVQAGVVHIKEQGIPVGPARGSAAASMAAYLLRITEVNPLEFPFLRFDRFISVDREDLPDIDLDFPSEARPLLRDFYSSMLGEGCVNNIGTFVYFKNKLAVDDVARVFRIPKFEVERLKDFLIERSSGDMRASSTIEDTVEQFPQAREIFEKHPDLRKSQLLEGNVKGFGVHAAGLVLSNEPITSVTAVLEREIKGNMVQVVSLDKYDAERQGLVKMDFLGLSTMSMIADSIDYLGMTPDDLYGLPLDDPDIYQGFKDNDVVGVFQFDGRAMRYVCGSLKPEKFSEIMDCNALARPGPLHNGAARTYAEIKQGTRAAEVLHPALAEITELTQFQIIYQEQILEICSLIGAFGRTMVADIRRIISRKKGEQAFNRQKAEFIKGCTTVHERMDVPRMSPKIGEQIWGDLITSGAYAFNAAHCAAYGLLAYWTMWLKVYHPDVFFAFSLARAQGKPERTHQLLRDGAKKGMRVLPPSPSRSRRAWYPVRKKEAGRRVPIIRAGFEQIHGIGEKQANNIIAYREEGKLKVWDDLINVKGVGAKTIERIEEFVQQEDPFGAFTLDKHIRQVKADLKAGKLGDIPLPTHSARDLPFEQGKEFSVVWLGTILQRNIRDIFELNRARTGEELDRDSIRDPHLNEWALLTAEDETDQLLLKIDRWKYPKFKHALFDFKLGQDLLLVIGVRPRYVSSRQIKIKQMYVIEP